jgi:hypothetical protein
MMIKFGLAGLIVLNCLTAFSYTIITKDNGGWFGFRTVTESHSGPNHQLACADPGRMKCEFGTAFGGITQGGEVINLESFEPIENMILDLLAFENSIVAGEFYFESDFFIMYSYDFNTDRLTIEIYTLHEASCLGFI